MPLFFVISGIFHKFDGTVHWKKHFRTLYIPTIFFCLLYIVLTFVVNILINGKTLSDALLIAQHHITGTVSGYILGGSMPNIICWFLFVLFNCKIVTDLLLKYLHKKHIIWTIVIGLALLTAGMYQSSSPWKFIKCLYLAQTFMALPFYLIGYELRNFLKRLEFRPLYLILIPICLFGTIGLTMLNGVVYINIVKFGHAFSNNLFNAPIFYLNALMGTTLMFVISLLPIKPYHFISEIAASLITVVGVQKVFNNIFLSQIGIDQPMWISAIGTVVIIVICYITHKILEKYCPKLIGKWKS